MTPPEPAAHDPAKARFLIIQAVRLSGVVMGVLGALILGDILPLPRFAGSAPATHWPAASGRRKAAAPA